MLILNIIIALIVAIGFWRSSTKEIERKTSNATLTKTIIFLLLTIATIVFYYKSYQVATFRNYILVQAYKGVYESISDSSAHNTPAPQQLYESKDTVKGIFILNRFSNKHINNLDPIKSVFIDFQESGFRSFCSFSNPKNHPTRLYPGADTLERFINDENIKHLYDISLYSNSIPSIFPFKTYEKKFSSGTVEDSTNSGSIAYESGKLFLNYENLVNGHDFDKTLLSRIITYYDNDSSDFIYLNSNNCTNGINTLNFFSAADLSQCIFEVIIRSDIPLEYLGVVFDIPIEINSLDIKRDGVTTRSFNINDFRNNNGKIDDLKYYHIKLPTLANLQLIRSLILTTVLTALLSLLFTNLYFYCRKKYKRYFQKYKLPFSTKKNIVLLWIPVGKIIVWSLIIAFSYLLLRTILNKYFSIDVQNLLLVNILIGISLILYICLISFMMRYLYNRGIYLKDFPRIIKGYCSTFLRLLKKGGKKLHHLYKKVQKRISSLTKAS